MGVTGSTDRLFFALYPDRDTAEQQIAPLALRLRSAQRLHGKILATERFHLTLHHLGDFAGLPQPLVQAACMAAASLRYRPFELVFDHAASFDNKRGRNNAFVLQGGEGVAAVVDFQSALGEAMKKVGLKPDARFTPHVTLLYDDRVVPVQPVTPPVRWTAHEFVLVHSLIGRGVHVPLGRWPLKP
ncbi:MAG: 2'-5' RNA ligase family protein [Pseudomonadota bacterium]